MEFQFDEIDMVSSVIASSVIILICLAVSAVVYVLVRRCRLDNQYYTVLNYITETFHQTPMTSHTSPTIFNYTEITRCMIPLEMDTFDWKRQLVTMVSAIHEPFKINETMYSIPRTCWFSRIGICVQLITDTKMQNGDQFQGVSQAISNAGSSIALSNLLSKERKD